MSSSVDGLSWCDRWVGPYYTAADSRRRKRKIFCLKQGCWVSMWRPTLKKVEALFGPETLRWARIWVLQLTSLVTRSHTRNNWRHRELRLYVCLAATGTTVLIMSGPMDPNLTMYTGMAFWPATRTMDNSGVIFLRRSKPQIKCGFVNYIKSVAATVRWYVIGW